MPTETCHATCPEGVRQTEIQAITALYQSGRLGDIKDRARALTERYPEDVLGYASMMVTILFLGGFQLISIGIVAEYLGRVYREVQNRPLYVVDQAHGLNADRVPKPV